MITNKDIFSLSDIILSNIHKITFPDAILEIMPILESAGLEHQKDIYKSAYDYNTKHGKLPTGEFLFKEFNGLFNYVAEEFHQEHLIEFIDELKKINYKLRVMEAINKDEIDRLSAIIYDHNDSSKEKVKYTMENFMYHYKKKKKIASGGVKTGVAEIDDAIVALAYQSVNVIAAPPRTGKTTFAISIAYNALMNEEKNVAYLTFEVSALHILANLISRHSSEIGKNIEAKKIKKYLIENSGEKDIEAVIDDWNSNVKGKLEVLSLETIGEVTPTSVMHELERVAQDMEKIDMLVVDHVTQTEDYGWPGVTNPNEVVSKYTSFFNNIALTFRRRGLILVLLTQITRDAVNSMDKNKSPGLTVFAKTSKLEQVAHTAMVLHATQLDLLDGSLGIFLVKNRDGEPVDDKITAFIDPKFFIVGHSEFSSSTVLNNAVDTLSSGLAAMQQEAMKQGGGDSEQFR